LRLRITIYRKAACPIHECPRPPYSGFYVDDQGRLCLNMREFLTAHGMSDTPELRAAVWDEIRDIFQDIPIIEVID
jgi:hypothetical protein